MAGTYLGPPSVRAACPAATAAARPILEGATRIERAGVAGPTAVELVAALQRVEALVRALRQDIDRVVLPTPEARIIEAVAAEWGIPEAMICGRGREASVALARQVAMVLCRDRGWSLAEVGRCFNRHHGTVAHALQAVSAACETDHRVASRVARVRQALEAVK